MTDGNTHKRVTAVRERLAALEDERRSLQNELVALERALPPVVRRDGLPPAVSASSPPSEKIALFRRLFVGHDDVFPLRWHNLKTGKSGYAPACSNEWKSGVCRKPQVKCGECPNQAFIPLSDTIVRRHLGGVSERSADGDFVAGVYPLLPDNSCHFLAADFDGDDWAADALAYADTCRTLDLPVAIERSRSGAGAHVWAFFDEPIPARLARQLGSLILTETMERRPEIGFASYDRLFPSQDIMPTGGFGNLIAMPLQYEPGSRWSYSNFGYILLGAVIERVSGMSYYDYVTLHVFAPAGMSSTGSASEDSVVVQRSVGYTRGRANEHLESNAPSLPYRGSPAGGGYSTVGDLVRFANALRENRLLDSAYTTLLITGKEATPSGKYAYGFGDRMVGGDRIVGHDGAAPGMNGELAIDLTTGYAVAVLSNIDPPAAEEVAEYIVNRLPRS
jgi:hypothetical protein